MPPDHISDDGLVAELGRRIALHRIARDRTQADFAAEAGVARSTVQRIEGGQSIQLSSFVKMLRVLDRLDGLDAVLAPEIRSPITELERQRARRRRVRRPDRRGQGAEPEGPAGVPWTWGDDERDG
jgi:transcriptional regulator with XRE-family HTH domain